MVNLENEKIDELNKSLDILIHYLDISEIEASPLITFEDNI